jgi:hypothetical protein
VKYTQVPLSLEELSKLWSVFFQTRYTVSVAYRATVVLIEAADTPGRVLPVRVRDIAVAPFQRARIDDVVPADPERTIVELGDTVAIRGSRLAGDIVRVRVGAAELDPVPGTVEPTRLEVELDDPALRAGILGVYVVYAGGSESNAAPLVLRPRIAVVQAEVTDALVPLELEPPVGRRQRVKLFLNELDAPATRAPHAYVFDAPAQNGIADPLVTETDRIDFPVAGVEPATYLVRVLVDGAESELGTHPVTRRFDRPTVDVP